MFCFILLVILPKWVDFSQNRMPSLSESYNKGSSMFAWLKGDYGELHSSRLLMNLGRV